MAYLIPRYEYGAGERTEGRTLELQSDCAASVDEHIEPEMRKQYGIRKIATRI